MSMSRGEKCFWAVLFAAALALLMACASGCAVLDRAYKQEVTWTNAPVVQVRTNVVVVTNAMEAGGAATVVTNFVPVFFTNVVNVPVTNLVNRPGAEAAIEATGSLVNTFAPGIGSLVALALGGMYHGYRQVRNRRVNEALIQGVETARAMLTTTPQGQALDTQFVKWLMEHQKEAGVFLTVSQLVERASDNPAARVTAQEILERVQRAQQQRVVTQGLSA